ncbi:MaoC family dehydratase N-terminal domain-containing protein [Tumebacillus sp. ITR2]|uniref:MaoC family dehydratase N-terminal domain-containing protein n=1 Tax=Tumebacillus amylolyticus TaxID=2801339 RepID=A0ABS1JEM2_9BACL|nr:MaoC family dehydratase N-terminal domain-containing protein [Tumebacillus amylolyticus]MBL0388731.1 MaoC family dehydratase N-terminal domain-containing protein [Tumebacillus amylolyticus]
MQNLTSIIGQTTSAVLNEVEKGAVRKFADAIGDPNPIFRTGDASGRITVPPTFSFTFDHGDLDGFSLKTDGLIHGEQEFNLLHPIYVGDTLSCSMTVKDVYERSGKSGSMTFLVLEQTGVNQHGKTCYHNVATIIIR